MPPLKVMFILSDMDTGGAQHSVLDLATYIDRNRFQPHVCCLREGGALVGKLRERNIPFHLVHFGTRLSPVGLWQLRNLFQDLGIHVVHTTLRRANQAGRVAAFLAGVPVVIAHHRDTIIDSNWRQRWLTGYLARKTDAIFCVSEEVRSVRLGATEEPADKLHVLHNFIEPSDYVSNVAPSSMKAELGFPADLPTVGIVGRLHPFKNHLLFLDAAKKLVEDDPAIHFAIIGDGKLRSGLEARVREIGLTGFVTFTGTRSDMSHVYRALDCTVLCSTREGFGKVILESQAAGVPVVANKVGAVGEILSSGGGLIVSDMTPEAFAAAIDHALQPEERRVLQQQAAKNVQRFSATRIMTELEDMYLDLCEKKHALQHLY